MRPVRAARGTSELLGLDPWTCQPTVLDGYLGAGYARPSRSSAQAMRLLFQRINRGTPENPGLVLTLECGGSCRGLVYRIAADRVQEEMHGIWKREMSFGSYCPKWLNCSVGAEKVSALAFTVNRDCSGYSGELPTDVMVHALSAPHA